MTLKCLVVVVQAIQRLAATHSVEAMVRSSPAGRFLDSQVCAHSSFLTGHIMDCFIYQL